MRSERRFKRTFAVLVPLLAVILTGGCSSRANPIPRPEPGLEALLLAHLTSSADGWNRGDLDAHFAFHADSIVYVGSGGPVRGLDDVRDRFRSTYFAPGAARQSLRFERVEVKPLGADHALQIGNWILTGGGQPDRSGWFSLIWGRTPEGWRIIQDHSS